MRSKDALDESCQEICQSMAEATVLSASPVQPGPDLEQRLFARIGLAPPVSPAPTVVRSGEGTWKKIAQGVSMRFLHEDRTMLVRMEPGAQLPKHPHNMDEQCLILEGSIEDAEGNTASAGDYVRMPKGTIHPSIRSAKGALFLIAYT